MNGVSAAKEPSPIVTEQNFNATKESLSSVTDQNDNATKEPPLSVSDKDVDVETLEDILYEILASGIGPAEKEFDLAHVETFLHEHARLAKSKQEFLDFFKEHGLSTDPDVHMKPSAIRPLPTSLKMTPPKHLAQPSRPQSAASTSNVSPIQSDVKTLKNSEPDDQKELLVEIDDSKLNRTWMLGWTAAVVVAMLSGLMGGLGYLLYQDVRKELEQTQLLQKQAVQEIRLLQDQLRDIQSDRAVTSAANEELEKKIDFLPETIMEELNQLRKERGRRWRF